MVTHPGTNRVLRRSTTLIETNTLPLSQSDSTELLRYKEGQTASLLMPYVRLILLYLLTALRGDLGSHDWVNLKGVPECGWMKACGVKVVVL